MEFILFLLSNFCVGLGMFLVLLRLGMASSKGRVAARAELKALNISPDTIVVLSFGVLARIYWSLSPPVVWQHESTWLQIFAVFELVFSVVIHFLLFSTSFVIRYGSDAVWGVEGSMKVRDIGAQTDFASLWNNFIIGVTRPRAVYEQAALLTIAALAISATCSYLFMPGGHPHAWPGTDMMMIFNMTADMLAMIPQLVLLASEGAAVAGKSTAVTTHFVALLSLARVFRLLFWLSMFLMWGEIVWVFILPDVIHTLLMADFIWKYVSQLGRDCYGTRSL